VLLGTFWADKSVWLPFMSPKSCCKWDQPPATMEHALWVDCGAQHPATSWRPNISLYRLLRCHTNHAHCRLCTSLLCDLPAGSSMKQLQAASRDNMQVFRTTRQHKFSTPAHTAVVAVSTTACRRVSGGAHPVSPAMCTHRRISACAVSMYAGLRAANTLSPAPSAPASPDKPSPSPPTANPGVRLGLLQPALNCGGSSAGLKMADGLPSPACPQPLNPARPPPT
jgi:hypothetical protein